MKMLHCAIACSITMYGGVGKRSGHEAISTSRTAGLRCCGVLESDARHGRPDFKLEAARARTGGNDGGPVHEQAERNTRILDDVCFIPLRRQAHEMGAMIHEIIRQLDPKWPTLGSMMGRSQRARRRARWRVRRRTRCCLKKRCCCCF